MAFVVRMRRVDIDTGGGSRIILLRGHDAQSFGINPGDHVQIRYKQKTVNVVADITHHSIEHGEVGLFEEVWRLLHAKAGDPLFLEVVSRPVSVQAIAKKLKGEELTAAEIKSIITDIVDHRLGTIETTYFVASGYVKPYTVRELVAMVKAMAETGDMFTWPGQIVVDKHSVGGLAGNRTTMVAIPIVASLGLTIPKTSSRAITSPSGTADTMEVLAPVSFPADMVKRIVHEANGCLIWGGGLSIAPADDIIIRVSRPLSLEPYDKMIVSILAKKVAMGVKYLIIDLPFGPGTKIPNRQAGNEVAKRFQEVAAAFKMKVVVKFDAAKEPIGQGIGPALEARDVVRVLQQTDDRPTDLEEKAIGLAGDLLELCGFAKPGQGKVRATTQLRSGAAWEKMQQIIKLQGGNDHIAPDDVLHGAVTHTIKATQAGTVKEIFNRAIDEVARTLGAPDHKLGGIFLHHKRGERVTVGSPLFTLYSASADRITMAQQALKRVKILTVGR
jgi:AMP phosphorylase